MEQAKLEAQADEIERVMREQKAPGRVTGGNVTPRWVQFLVQTAPGVKVNRVETLSREIAMALCAQTARMSISGNAELLIVPRSDPQPVKLSKLLERLPAKRIPVGTAVLGLADDGAPLLVRLPSIEVRHVLLAMTEDQREAVLTTIGASLAAMNYSRMLQLVGFPIRTRNELRLETRKIRTLMQRREGDLVREPRIVIALSNAEAGGLGEVLERGHVMGIHLIVHTTSPKAPIGSFGVAIRAGENGGFVAEASEGAIGFTLAECDGA